MEEQEGEEERNRKGDLVEGQKCRTSGTSVAVSRTVRSGQRSLQIRTEAGGPVDQMSERVLLVRSREAPRARPSSPDTNLEHTFTLLIPVCQCFSFYLKDT